MWFVNIALRACRFAFGADFLLTSGAIIAFEGEIAGLIFSLKPGRACPPTYGRTGAVSAACFPFCFAFGLHALRAFLWRLAGVPVALKSGAMIFSGFGVSSPPRPTVTRPRGST